MTLIALLFLAQCGQRVTVYAECPEGCRIEVNVEGCDCEPEPAFEWMPPVCVTGPAPALVYFWFQYCKPFDVDNDGDVDLLDVAAHQRSR